MTMGGPERPFGFFAEWENEVTGFGKVQLVGLGRRPMSIGRIWRTSILADRAEDYERFARDVSLPMFRRQQGFEGVLMLRDGTECLVITLWRDSAALEALARSESYRATVQEIVASGFLAGEQSVAVYDVHLIEGLVAPS